MGSMSGKGVMVVTMPDSRLLSDFVPLLGYSYMQRSSPLNIQVVHMKILETRLQTNFPSSFVYPSYLPNRSRLLLFRAGLDQNEARTNPLAIQRNLCSQCFRYPQESSLRCPLPLVYHCLPLVPRCYRFPRSLQT